MPGSVADAPVRCKNQILAVFAPPRTAAAPVRRGERVGFAAAKIDHPDARNPVVFFLTVCRHHEGNPRPVGRERGTRNPFDVIIIFRRNRTLLRPYGGSAQQNDYEKCCHPAYHIDYPPCNELPVCVLSVVIYRYTTERARYSTQSML